MKHKQNAIAVLLLTIAAAAVWGGGSSEPAAPRSISVSGEGSISLTPDIATLDIGVETEDPQAQSAVQDNAERMQELYRSLDELGISRDEIRTINYSVMIQRPPQHSREDEDTRTEPYYRVVNTIQVTLDDPDMVGTVLDTAFSAGADSVRNVRFQVSSTAEAELRALELAMEHARSKATRMAAAHEAELGDALWVNEEYGGGIPRQESDMVMYARSAEATPIAAGDFTITARVQVTFELK
ncbi:MAG: SIMPL domain-containing protein [Spirochaeta sp.]